MEFLSNLNDKQLTALSDLLYHHDLPQRCLCKRPLPWSDFLEFYLISLKENGEDLQLNNEFFEKFHEFMNKKRSLFIPSDIAEIFVKYHSRTKNVIVDMKFINSFEKYLNEKYPLIKNFNRKVWERFVEYYQNELDNLDDFIAEKLRSYQEERYLINVSESERLVAEEKIKELEKERYNLITEKFITEKFNNYLRKMTEFNPINTLCCRGILINPPQEVIRKFRESLLMQEINQTVDKKQEELEDEEEERVRKITGYRDPDVVYTRKFDETSQQTSGFNARIVPTAVRCYSGVGTRVTGDDQIKRETEMFFKQLSERAGPSSSSAVSSRVSGRMNSGNITGSASRTTKPKGFK